jgi:hypothetical protein
MTTRNCNPLSQAILSIKEFLPHAQLQYLAEVCRNREAREELREPIERLSQVIASMPKTYEQEGKSDEAVVHLHYFAPMADWWITERDSDPDGEGQVQAFGIATIISGGELEFGYISIKELCSLGLVELDFHFQPCTVAEIRAKRREG